jgi:hypothetical protein
MLTVGVLLKSPTDIRAFIILTVGVLLISLTGILPFIIVTIRGSAQIVDWYLGLCYS